MLEDPLAVIVEVLATTERCVTGFDVKSAVTVACSLIVRDECGLLVPFAPRLIANH